MPGRSVRTGAAADALCRFIAPKPAIPEDFWRACQKLRRSDRMPDWRTQSHDQPRRPRGRARRLPRIAAPGRFRQRTVRSWGTSFHFSPLHAGERLPEARYPTPTSTQPTPSKRRATNLTPVSYLRDLSTVATWWGGCRCRLVSDRILFVLLARAHAHRSHLYRCGPSPRSYRGWRGAPSGLTELTLTIPPRSRLSRVGHAIADAAHVADEVRPRRVVA